MKNNRLLISLLVFVSSLFCLLSCGSGGPSLPSLSDISLPDESKDSEDSEESVLIDAEAEEAKFKDFSLFYVPERGGYLVGDYRGSLTSLIVPDRAIGDDGIAAPIIGLADYAFNGRKGITTVLLGKNITYIGDYAFVNTDITDLRIAGGLTHVGGHAFDGCRITFYQKDGFDYLPSWNDPFHILLWDGASSIYHLRDSCRHLIFKPGIDEVPDCALLTFTSLLTASIPSSVTSIGYVAFYFCSSLSSIEIPPSVTSIGKSAFQGCSSLSSIDIPSSVAFIDAHPFMHCGALSSISVDPSNPVYDSREGCNAIIKTETNELVQGSGASFIPSSVTSIGDFAFEGSSLASVEIPSSVLSIGDGAFSRCSSLASIDVDAANPVYDSREGCNAIIRTKDNRLVSGCKNAFIPSSVTSIGDSAFEGCSSLASVEIPSSVTSIGDSAFYCCSSLASVEIPSSVTSIGESTFYCCSSLALVEIPSSVASIGSRAFEGCSSLVSIVIPNSVTAIEKSAFFDCISLTSVFIPSSVTSIGSSAFQYCYSATFYCEVERQPEGWDTEWKDENTSVVWGYKT